MRLRVRVTPRARGDLVEGPVRLSDGSAVLAVKVRAVPEDGKANAAVERLLARRLEVAPSQVHVVAGHKGRHKTVQITGESAAVCAALARLESDNGKGEAIR